MSSLDHSRTRGRRGFAVASIALLAAAGLAAPADAAHHDGDPAARHHVSQVDKAADVVTARLKGSNEVPGPGDPNGRGSVTIRLRPGAEKVCANARWRNIGRPNAAHIHKGRPGVSGDVIVDLTTAVTGGSHCATAVSTAAINKIAAHPRRYYFNIHTGAFPGGAIRGQLHG